MSWGLINSTKRVSVREEGQCYAHFTYISLLLMFSKTFSPTERRRIFFIHSLDMKPFYWFKWYEWLKMAFKMSQEFLTASMDITEDFHILHSAYIYICYSILKAKAYNWLPNSNTHTTSNNYKQKATGHVTSLANGQFTGSDAPFVAKIWLLRFIKKI